MPPKRAKQSSSVDAARAAFEQAYKKYGPRVEALLWSGEESQRGRFEILCDVGDMKGASVLDVGCGLGHLRDYLLERFGDVRYTGIDITREFLDAARERCPTIDVREATVDALKADERWDYVLCSGIFNLGYDFAYFEHVLVHMCERANKAVAVNLLSKHSLGTFNPGSSYFDPADIVTVAARFSRSFSLRHDYRANDCTLYVYRDVNLPGYDEQPGKIPTNAVRRLVMPLDQPRS